jgi:hypothetical protein
MQSEIICRHHYAVLSGRVPDYSVLSSGPLPPEPGNALGFVMNIQYFIESDTHKRRLLYFCFHLTILNRAKYNY